MSTEYVVLLHDNEDEWANTSGPDRIKTYERHGEFARRCAEGGHKITGGAELKPAATAKILRGPGVGVTDGPYAETAEQLGGFYVVETDDSAAFIDLLNELLTGTSSPVELRETVTDAPS
ncbi:YciI family protein [Arthrobacter sp. H5]|uniref:YciI family protein n=1 Tax=Arthrobacter sp. H5 TaxID=1267973 RepID=UPI000486FA77|nr:YciI family protein [Arthrobacter sp. H5]